MNSKTSWNIIVLPIVLLVVFLTSFYNYLLFHSIAEIFSIFIAFCIFLVAWNSRRLLDNSYFLFLGIAYLFIGVVDLTHTLAYPGMGVFKGYGSNLALQLWIIARYIESLALLIAVTFFKRQLNSSYLFCTLLVILSLLLGSVFYWDIFPILFIEGKGLTPIKRWGKPSDIAKTILAIVSGSLPFSTGTVLNVDGGFHLHRL